MRFLLTVSPVPLIATATQKQVVVATAYSKSVLRAVAGFLANKYHYVDYFPSYEIISSHVMRGTFYLSDQRSVIDEGVQHVMKQFFEQHPGPKIATGVHSNVCFEQDETLCDEVLLAAFGENK